MKPHLFIGLPSHEFCSPLFFQALHAFTLETEFHLSVKWHSGDGISRARNQLSADFLASECTHLLFVDTDLLFNAAHVARLVSHDESVVAGFYPKKKDGACEWVCNTPNEGVKPPDARGLYRMKYMGTGFMLIKRAVFEAMEMGFDIKYTADESGRHECDFWTMGVYRFPDGVRRYLSEDWYFCQRWLDLGGRVWGDSKVILKHIGQAVFPLQSQQSAFSTDAATPDLPSAA